MDGCFTLNKESSKWPDSLSADVCVPYSVRLWSGPGGLLYEEWRISVHLGLSTHTRHPLQWLWGLRGGGSGHSPRQDLPPCLLRLYHLQVRYAEKTQLHLCYVLYFTTKAMFAPSSTPQVRSEHLGNGKLLSGMRFHWQPYLYLVGGVALPAPAM